ncbi:hypothetical protein I4U23_015559 [Adineta vaga]|nr:hypothetical protein I4U23_015559 [Adineta vaga]
MQIVNIMVMFILLVIFVGFFIVYSNRTIIELSTKNIKSTSVTIILYNRVPKCGSTLLMNIFDSLSKQTNAFKFLSVFPYTKFHRLSVEDQYNLTTDLLQQAYDVHPQSIVYERHFHFIPFISTSSHRFYYINQYRDPLERILSGYDYRRYACVVIRSPNPCKLIIPSARNLTMDECVATGDPSRCITNSYGVRPAIPYFCGHSSICDDTIRNPLSKAAVALSKANIERYFIHIGLIDYLENSLELLESIEPTIFAGLVDTYMNNFKRLTVNKVPRQYRYGISNETRKTLLQLLGPEYELYNFIRKRFFDHYTRVFHRLPMKAREIE